MAAESDLLDQLELPKTDLGSVARNFGPGMILMMTGIGTSHLVTAPAAGGRFEYALAWCLPVAYLFKYYGFEMAFRFTHATGRSMLDAYATAPRKWPLWYVMVSTLLQCAIGQAGRLAAASAVVYYFLAEYVGVGTRIEYIGVILGLVSVVTILIGRYAALEMVTKLLAAMLFISAVAVYVVEPAPVAALGRFFIVDIPEGSWLVIAAFLGLLPTGIDVSLQGSEWGKAKRVGMGRIRAHLERAGLVPTFDPLTSTAADLRVDTAALPPHAREYCRRWFRIGQWDFGVGYLVSFIIAVIFLLLSAEWLYPSAVEGDAVIGEIAGIFTRSVGPSMMLVFLAGAFAATFSTAFNYFDGWPRVVGACCRNLFLSTSGLSGIAREDLDSERRRRWYSEYNIYRFTMLYSLAASVAIIAGVPRPVWLVLVASALALFVAPVIYFLNLYYCLTVIPRSDTVFYPSPIERRFAGLSVVVFSALTFIIIMARVFGVALFGG